MQRIHESLGEPGGDHSATAARFRLHWLVLLLGVLVTLALFWREQRQASAKLDSTFRELAANRAQLIQRELAINLNDLEDAQRFCETVRDLSREQFQRFAAVLVRRPGIQSLEWVPRVEAGRRAAFEAAARTQHSASYQIFERGSEGKFVPAASREEYFPIQFVEPDPHNGPVLGFDLGSEPLRRKALDLARDTASPVVTEPLQLVQGATDQTGFLVLVPVYERDQPGATVAERRARLRGLVVGRFLAGTVVEQALAASLPRGLAMQLRDQSSQPASQLLHERRPQLAAGDASDSVSSPPLRKLRWETNFPFAGRDLQVVVQANRRFVQMETHWFAWVLLCVGLAFSGLLALYVESLASARRRAEQRVRERTAELQSSEAKLAASQQRLAAIIAAEPECVKLVAADCTLLEMNRAGLAMIEADDAGQVVGKNVFGLIAPKWRAAYERLNQRVFQGESVILEFEMIGLKGTRRWFESHAVPLRDEQGKITAQLAITRDVTERRRVEAELRTSEERWRFALGCIQAGTWELDLSDHTASRSLRHDQIFGYPELVPKWTYEMFLEHVLPDDRAKVDASFQAAVNERQPWRFECRIQTVKGEVRWIRAQGEHFTNPSGHPALMGMVEDITGRKQSESAMESLYHRYQQILHTSLDAIHILDREGYLREWNDAFLAHLGYTAEEARSLHVADWDAQWNRAELVRELASLLEAGRTFETIHRRKDGTLRFVEISAGGLVLEQGPWLIASARDITARKQAEKALEEVISRQRATLESTADGILVVDGQGRIMDFNERFLRLWRFPEELVAEGRRRDLVAALNSPDDSIKFFFDQLKDPAAFGKRVQELYANPEETGFDVLEFKDGRILERFSIPQRLDGKVVGRVWSFRDVTEHRRAEGALRQFERVTATSSDLIALIGPDFRYKLVNEAYLQARGLRAEEMVGHEMREIVGEERFETEARPQVERCLRGEAFDVLEWNDFGSGNRRFHHVKLTPYREPDGTISGAVMTGRDVTALKQSEEALRQERDFAVNLTNALGQGVTITNAAGCFEFVNPAYARMIGRSPAEIIGHQPAEFTVAEDRARLTSAHQQRLKGESSTYDMRLCHADGHLVPVVITGVPRWQEGQVRGAIAVITDLTEHERTKQVLRESEQRFATIFRTSPVGICLVRVADDRILDVNDAMVRIFGYTREEAINRTDLELNTWVDPWQRQQFVERVLAQGRVEEVTISFRRKSGEVGELAGSMELIELGGERCLLIFGRDITEFNRTQGALRQAQKMESIGHLAGGVAHHFNNILAAMTLNLGLLRERSRDPEADESLKMMLDLARDAGLLVGQLLAFGRKSMLQVKPCDLHQVVSGSCRLLAPLLGERIRLEFSARGRSPWIEADRALIEQVVMNLCLNARDAMPAGGRLRIDLEEIEVSETIARLHPQARPGRFARLAVTDTGHGMDAATLQHLFEPFFTTKEIGRGTGLGLATAYGIVEQHKGWIEVESEPSLGTTFRVLLPAVAPAETMERPVGKPPMPAGARTILLVEDDPAVRRAFGSYIRHQGYRVLEAVDGPAARVVWDAHPGQIDLLFTDMVMPGGENGLELALGLRAAKPELKVILSSGYSFDLVEFNRPEAAQFVRLTKPFSPEELTAALHHCFGPLPDGGEPGPPTP